jgi:hypothetical protein
VSTQYCDSTGRVVAIRCARGPGAVLDLYVSDTDWSTLESVTDEGGNECARGEVEQSVSAVNPWSRLRARAMAIDLERQARSWSQRGNARIAYALTAWSQRVRIENRC